MDRPLVIVMMLVLAIAVNVAVRFCKEARESAPTGEEAQP